MIEPINLPDATAQPAEYVAALLRTLGDRDPLEVCAQTPAIVRGLCQHLDEAAWQVPLAAGEWSALQVVGHLLDVEVVFGFRWRLALTQDSPAYPGYDEKAWSELPRPAPPRLLDAYTALREANLPLLRSLGPDELRRVAVHEEQGPEDVQRMIDKIGGHDLAHLNQLQRTIAIATPR